MMLYTQEMVMIMMGISFASNFLEEEEDLAAVEVEEEGEEEDIEEVVVTVEVVDGQAHHPADQTTESLSQVNKNLTLCISKMQLK